MNTLAWARTIVATSTIRITIIILSTRFGLLFFILLKEKRGGNRWKMICYCYVSNVSLMLKMLLEKRDDTFCLRSIQYLSKPKHAILRYCYAHYRYLKKKIVEKKQQNKSQREVRWKARISAKKWLKSNIKNAIKTKGTTVNIHIACVALYRSFSLSACIANGCQTKSSMKCKKKHWMINNSKKPSRF